MNLRSSIENNPSFIISELNLARGEAIASLGLLFLTFAALFSQNPPVTRYFIATYISVINSFLAFHYGTFYAETIGKMKTKN